MTEFLFVRPMISQGWIYGRILGALSALPISTVLFTTSGRPDAAVLPLSLSITFSILAMLISALIGGMFGVILGAVCGLIMNLVARTVRRHPRFMKHASLLMRISVGIAALPLILFFIGVWILSLNLTGQNWGNSYIFFSVITLIVVMYAVGRVYSTVISQNNSEPEFVSP